jgi:hypothetical protein
LRLPRILEQCVFNSVDDQILVGSRERLLNHVSQERKQSFDDCLYRIRVVREHPFMQDCYLGIRGKGPPFSDRAAAGPSGRLVTTTAILVCSIAAGAPGSRA